MLVPSLAGPIEPGTDHVFGVVVVGSVPAALPEGVVVHPEPAVLHVELGSVVVGVLVPGSVCVVPPGSVSGCVGSD